MLNEGPQATHLGQQGVPSASEPSLWGSETPGSFWLKVQFHTHLKEIESQIYYLQIPEVRGSPSLVMSEQETREQGYQTPITHTVVGVEVTNFSQV